MSSVAVKNPAPSEMPWLKNYPQGIDWDLQAPPQPLFSFLEQTIAKYGDRDAVHFSGHVYSYKALGKLVDRAAAGLQALGVKKGVKAGLFMTNSAYSVVMYYAILKSGGTVVNYNPVYAERDLIAQAEDSETDILVSLDVPAILDKAVALLDKTRINKIIVCPLKQDMAASGKTLELPGKGGAFTWFCDLIANDGKPAPSLSISKRTSRYCSTPAAPPARPRPPC